jgi:hypothetical protein
MRSRYQPKRDVIDAHKVAAGCVDCGFNAHPAALQYDHTTPGGKGRDVSLMVTSGASIQEIMAEIEKCEVVCANCHAIRTHARGYPGTGRKYKR